MRQTDGDPAPDDHAARPREQGETFAVSDASGDILSEALGTAGLYHEGTRFLSGWTLAIEHDRPLLLASSVSEDNTRLVAHLAARCPSPMGTLSVERTRCLWGGCCFDRIELRNYGHSAVTVVLRIQFQADFADLFEVRGTRRTRRGQYRDPAVEPHAVSLAYEGLDGALREARLVFDPQPRTLSADMACFDVTVAAQGEAVIAAIVECAVGTRPSRDLTVARACDMPSVTLGSPEAPFCGIETSHPEFNRWLAHSRLDLEMLITETADGPYPYAGIPWFSTPFGRDGIITALACLKFNPGLARGVLAHLAATQARELNSDQDAQPGKICHEERLGEMAALGEVPFRRYYGSVDATPLFIVLAEAYYERSGDLAFIERIWPNIDLALHWIDTYGDEDGDGFVEYSRLSPGGLVHQGWKDSGDSVFHADGRLADGPVALCEVQGYVYAARRGAAFLAAALGRDEMVADLSRRARLLRERFEQAFWRESLSTYALALDGRKTPCDVRASNAGHCLWTGIASPKRARMVAQTLLQEDSFSGWGVRTIASKEARYDPLSYHNGSIWPHDNAVIAAGMGRYRYRGGAIRILTGLFDAARSMERWRLPELFCGFPRRPGEGPVPYPVACAPQAWASASVFCLLQATLGLTIQAPLGRVWLSRPRLPEYLEWVRLSNLSVLGGVVDLLLERHARGVGVYVLRREGNVRVVADE